MNPRKNNPQTEHFPRLVKVYHLIAGNPGGITARELAGKCQVNVRTIYRDIEDLERAGVPLWEERHKYGIESAHFLPPISLTVPEAVQIFLALRLLLQFSRRYSMDVANLFLKLGPAVPAPLRQEISKASSWMLNFSSEPRLARNLSLLGQAWVSRQRARIAYCSIEAESPTSRIIEPYFIEPAAAGRSSYVIAYCCLKNEIRTFKVERIESVYLTGEYYEIPEDFDANKYLSPSLGIIVTHEEAKSVNLRFKPELARIIGESVWHPSQELKKKPDGSLLMKMTVNETPELVSWILGWGDRVEVIGPESLRSTIKKKVEKMAAVYAK